MKLLLIVRRIVAIIGVFKISVAVVSRGRFDGRFDIFFVQTKRPFDFDCLVSAPFCTVLFDRISCCATIIL